MTNSLQKKLYENGYLIVKNVLNFRRDLKPILNDMEFVMDCLIQKYAKKRDIKKVLNFDFKKKYSYISKLNINDLDQYFNTRLPRDHVKKDSDYFATQSLWNLITNKNILDVVENISQQISSGNKNIRGVMIESHLIEGNQKISDSLTYGQSITDACIGWDDTLTCLQNLSDAVSKRRSV